MEVNAMADMEWYEIRDLLNNTSVWSKGYTQLVADATEELTKRNMVLVRTSFQWVVFQN